MVANTYVSEAELRRAWASAVEAKAKFDELVKPAAGEPATTEELIRRAEAYILQHPGYQPALTRLAQLNADWEKRFAAYEQAMNHFYELGYAWEAAQGHLCPERAAAMRGEPYNGSCAEGAVSEGWVCLRREIMEGR
jgi:hypothetical protein